MQLSPSSPEGGGEEVERIVEYALEEVPRDTPLAVICSSGYRSPVAASVLPARGYRAVRNVPGGMEAWRAAGLPTSAD